MSFTEILILLLIAGVCGGIAKSIVGLSRGGCIVSIVVGFIGAFIGRWLSAKMGLPDLFVIKVGNTNFQLIWSIIGAIIFVALLSIITPGKK